VPAPDTSVVIATYNHGRFIAEALRSVVAQRGDRPEIVVVDDGSTDGTAETLAPWRESIRYVRQENRGLYPARNRGLAESGGAFVAFLDADDAWEPGALAALRAAFDEDPRLGVAAPTYVPVDAEGQLLGPPFRKRSPGRQVTTASLLITDADVPGCLYRRAALHEAGAFPETNRWAGDYEMWLALSARWSIVVLKEAMLRKREHGGNMSSNAPRVLPDKIAAVERFLESHPDYAVRHRSEVRRAQSKNHERLAKWCLRSGNAEHLGLARESLRRAIALNPSRPKLRWLAALAWARR
jgi:glycosyltransferase involved in cell wall biosynthesis